jgi:hypothetical protein
MNNEEKEIMLKPHALQTEQNIKQLVTIASGSSDSISINIPDNSEVFLKGYGYTYYSNSTYQLRVGNTSFPERTDQEGSIVQPMIFSLPPKANPNSKIKLLITNNGSSSRTYEVVFYILTDRILDQTSNGGELTIATKTANNEVETLGTLDEPESTTAYSVPDGINQHIFAITISNIDTSVTIRYEGSIDETNWFNLNINETDTTYTANGTYSATYSGTLKQVRVTLVSEDGGTAVSVLCKYLAV